MTAPHRQKCPKCKGRAERLHSAPAIQFKGAGWYVTDYARKSASGEAKPEKAEKPVAETKEKAEKKEPAKKEHKEK